MKYTYNILLTVIICTILLACYSIIPTPDMEASTVDDGKLYLSTEEVEQIKKTYGEYVFQDSYTVTPTSFIYLYTDPLVMPECNSNDVDCANQEPYTFVLVSQNKEYHIPLEDLIKWVTAQEKYIFNPPKDPDKPDGSYKNLERKF